MLTLNLITLLYTYLLVPGVFVVVLDFGIIYVIISSVKKGSFISSFPIYVPFIFFCCLIELAKTSLKILNRSVEKVYPCFDPNYSGRIFSFSPLNMILAIVFCLHFLSIVEIPGSDLLRIFIMTRCWIMSNTLSESSDSTYDYFLL